MAVPPSSVPRAEMPAEPTQARRFGKARTAQSGALHEDYVELISDLLASGTTDIAQLQHQCQVLQQVQSKRA